MVPNAEEKEFVRALWKMEIVPVVEEKEVDGH